MPLRCGDQLSHSTLIQGRPNQWSGYGCTQRLESGPEVLYAFQANARYEVTVRLTNLQVDIDLLLLDACDSWVCMAASSTPLDLQHGAEAITFQAQAGRAYSLAVDGYDGASGEYTIAVDCVE
jgi:hypothetical protein